MNLETVRDIRNEVLFHAGELTDGTSPYTAKATSFIQKVYRSLMSGGNEFDISCAESWPWALARHPIVLTLIPPYEIGTTALTSGSRAGTLSVAPAYSLEGYYLKIESNPEYYRIRSHTAGSPSFVIDQPFPQDSGVFNFKAIKLEYDVIDDSVTISQYNDQLNFSEDGTSVLTAALTHGVYSPADLCTLLQTALQTVGTGTYAVTFSSITRKFTLTSTNSVFSLLYSSVPGILASILPAIGFGTKDYSGALTYTADVPLNGIERLTREFTVYRNTDISQYYKNDGKISSAEIRSMERDYPLTSLNSGVPNQFAEIAQRSNGIKTIRFNMFVLENVRVEIPYIPILPDLADNAVSFPLVPISHRDFLVYASAYYLLNDKSDNKATEFAALAKAKLASLINHNRSPLMKANRNFGRIITRPNQMRPWRLRSDGL